jgi:hypothetical protein
MINSTKGGELVLRKLGGVLSYYLFFYLSFAAFLPNLEFCGSIILDAIFELVFGLWSFSCASIGLEFKIQTLCTWSCQCTHQEKD